MTRQGEVSGRSPLGELLDMREIADESTLDVAIQSDDVRPSSARPDKRVRRVELQFTSQEWHGTVWRHPVRLYVPVDYAGSEGAGIIGTAKSFFEPDDPAVATAAEGRDEIYLMVRGPAKRVVPETGADVESEFGEGTALDLGMPIAYFTSPADLYFGFDETDLMGYGGIKAAQTGDYTWQTAYAIVKSYLRMITLLQALPQTGTARAVLSGCSKRGSAVSLAAGSGDPRVAGVMVNCFPGGNTPYATGMKAELFGMERLRITPKASMGPGAASAAESIVGMYTPLGLEMSKRFDAYQLREWIKCPFLVTLGTNDPLFGGQNQMMNALSGDRALLMVDNAAHTSITAKQLAAWRMWLAHAFRDRPVPAVTLDVELDGSQAKVTASVHSQTPVSAVKLFYAFAAPYPPAKTLNWVRSVWQSKTMEPAGEGRFVGSLPLRDDARLAYYAEVEDSWNDSPGFVTSLVEVD